jgi:hypothetical protein
MPCYLTEEGHAADHAAHVRAMRSNGDNWRQRVASEEEWRASRRTQSEAPGEGDTFLPGG